MDKCLYKLTDVKLPHCRAQYKSDCGFLYARISGSDNKPIEGEQCMKCHKSITLIEADKIIKLNFEKCPHCRFLATLGEVQSNREYWIITEIFVHLHNGKDYCDWRKKDG